MFASDQGRKIISEEPSLYAVRQMSLGGAMLSPRARKGVHIGDRLEHPGPERLSIVISWVGSFCEARHSSLLANFKLPFNYDYPKNRLRKRTDRWGYHMELVKGWRTWPRQWSTWLAAALAAVVAG